MMADSLLPSSQSDSRPSSLSETVSEVTSDQFSVSTTSTSPPPTPHDIDRWNRHISLQEFGEGLQDAAKALFPSERKSRYTNVTVLILSWQDEDPNLPVSVEISRLVHVFKDIYHYDVEEWQIPTQNSHWAVSRKIMEFVQPAPNDKEHLKIVYYAGHGRLTKTRLLEWTSWRDNPRSKSQSRIQPVQWSGIQVLLEQAESDVLILLDCCSAGTANSGGGSGVTELIAACPFNAAANGVGQYSFTNSLVIELTELSQKPSFSVGELYSNIFIRAQCRLTEHGRERHPAPIHLVLTRQSNFPRSIQLSVRNQTKTTTELNQDLRIASGTPSPDDTSPGSSDSGPILCPTDLHPAQSPIPTNKFVPRLLFAIRLNESFQPSELSAELLSEWFRMIPLIGIEEVKVEAGFNSFSSIIMVSIPIALYAYIPTDPAIMCLGPVTSENLILQKNQQPLREVEYSRKATSSVSGSVAGSRDGRCVVSANMRKKRVRAFSSSWTKLRTGRSPSRPTKTSCGTPPLPGTRTKTIALRKAAESKMAGKTTVRLPQSGVSCPEKTSLRSVFSKTHLLPSTVSCSEKSLFGSIFTTAPEVSVQRQPTTVLVQLNDDSQEAVYQKMLGGGSSVPKFAGQPSLTTKKSQDKNTSRSNKWSSELNHGTGGMMEQHIQSSHAAESIELDNLNSRGRVSSRVGVLSVRGQHDEMTDARSVSSTTLYSNSLRSAISQLASSFGPPKRGPVPPLHSDPFSPAQEAFIFAVTGETPRSSSLNVAWTWYQSFLESRIREAWVPLLRQVLQAINESSYAPLESDFTAVMRVFTAIVIILRRTDIAISDIVDELYNQGILKETDDDRSHASQLVFGSIGWICLLYTPKIHVGSKHFELATPEINVTSATCDTELEGFIRHRPGHKAIQNYQQSLEYGDQQLHLLLRRFGNIVPERDAGRTRGFETAGKIYDDHWIELSLVCYHTLHTIAEISIEWVDCLCLHLEFDPRMKTLRIFRFPSFCFIMASNQNSGPLSQLFRESCATDWPPADVDDAREYFKEVLLSYRLIFGKDKRSAKHFNQLEAKGAQSRHQPPDQLLEILCGQGSDSTQVLQLLNEIRISDSRLQFSPNDDFPFLGRRLLQLQKHVQNQHPNGLRGLWYDKRDAFRWWTFWGVLIIGGLVIVLTFIQLVFQLRQIYY